MTDEERKAQKYAYQRKWAKENPEKILDYNRRYIEKHRAEYNEYQREYQREYLANHPGLNREKCRRYREKHREQWRAYQREYKRAYRLKHQKDEGENNAADHH